MFVCVHVACERPSELVRTCRPRSVSGFVSFQYERTTAHVCRTAGGRVQCEDVDTQLMRPADTWSPGVLKKQLHVGEKKAPPPCFSGLEEVMMRESCGAESA